MKHTCKVTVLDKKLYPELQGEYLADPESGACPCFEIGQEYLFEREDGKDDFWHFGRDLDPKFPCAEAWDAISRYIYTALAGGANRLVVMGRLPPDALVTGGLFLAAVLYKGYKTLYNNKYNFEINR